MNIDKKVAIIMTIILVSAVKFACAAMYYVDYSGGNDYNQGNSISKAWKHCPGDNNAVGNAASVNLAGGDIVYFKGGVIYKGAIYLNWSGSDNTNRIIYDGNSDGSWGIGRSVISDNKLLYYMYANGSRNYITIRGFEFTGNAVRNSSQCNLYPSEFAIMIGNYSIPSNGIVIDNNYIHDMNYWFNDCAEPCNQVPFGNGIYIYYGNYAVISNNHISKVGASGISADRLNNSIIIGNKINDYITWGIDVSGYYGGSSNNIISGNTIYDLYHHDAGFRTGTCDPHTDFVFIRESTGTRPSNNIVEKNLFYNNYSFTDSAGTAQLYLSSCDNTEVRNNVFINPHSYYAVHINGYDVKVYNNTFYVPRVTPIFLNTIGSNSRIINNITLGNNEYLALYNDNALSSLGEVNFNLFLNNSRIASKAGPPYASWDLPQWQAIGFDINSVTTGSDADVNFVSTIGYPTSCEIMDLRLRWGSPAIGVGSDLSSSGFHNDFLGNQRNGPWDMGAYQFMRLAPKSPKKVDIK